MYRVVLLEFLSKSHGVCSSLIIRGYLSPVHKTVFSLSPSVQELLHS